MQLGPFAVQPVAVDHPVESYGFRVAVGDRVLDLAALASAAGHDSEVFEQPSLNALMSLGPSVWAEGRLLLQSLLADESGRDVVEPHLLPLDAVTLHLPIEVADYVDFYASEHHAANVGAIFLVVVRIIDALMPLWNPKKQALHDTAAKTQVVKIR